jgi:DedD protein
VDKLVKQRLVGALILVALAVVFWPIIFVSDEARSPEGLVTVPPPPPIDRTELREPDSAGLRRLGDAQAQTQIVRDVPFPGDGAEQDTGVSGEGADGDSTPDEIAVAEADAAVVAALPPREDVVPVPTLDEARDTLAEPALDEDGLPIAFSLQVATMADRERAEELRSALIDGGYKAYVKRLRRDDRVLYRVLVGPRFQRDELLPVKAAVDETWRVDSLIIRYVP